MKHVNGFFAGHIMFHITVERIAVRPVTFDCNKVEAFLLYEFLRDLGAPGIILMCAM
jgi:hypothetical protein